MNKFHDALETLGRPMTYYPRLAILIGLKESIFLSQLVYWTPRGRNVKGNEWIYKSAEQFQLETGLSYKEQRRVRSVLVKRGLIEEEYHREEHVMYFRVVPEKINNINNIAHNNEHQEVPAQRSGEHLPNGQVAPAQRSGEHLPNGQVAPAQRSGGTCPTVSSYNNRDYTEITQRLQAKITQNAHARSDDEMPVSVPAGTSPRPAAGEVLKPETVDLIGMIYAAFPRKEGHRAGIEAIEKAVDRIRKGEVPTKDDWRDACRFLHERTVRYAHSPAGRRTDKTKIPHPATWFNQSRYLDDENNWQYTGEDDGRLFSKARTSGNIAAAKVAIAAITGDTDAYDPGGGEAGGCDPADIRALLRGTNRRLCP